MLKFNERKMSSNLLSYEGYIRFCRSPFVVVYSLFFDDE